MGSPSSTTASATSIESPLTNTRQHGEPVFTCKGFAVGVLLSFVAGAGGVYDLSHQGAGAFIVFALFGLWTARDHLKAVWRRLWLTDDAVRAVDDSEEALPYRACVVLLAGSLLFVGFWLWRAGMPVVVLPVLLGICVIYYIVITRVTAAGGIPTTRPPIVPPYFVISGFGTSILGERGLVALGFASGWMAEMRLFPMIACANSLKLAEVVRGPKRRLFIRLRPFFLGMILGEATTGGVWLIIDAVTGTYGNRITAM